MIIYLDQPTHGSQLDIIEQETEITLQVSDYGNIEPGKPYKSGTLSIPETKNNRACLGSLFDADGSNKTRIIPNVTLENDAIQLQGSIVITGQTYQNRTNVLQGVFLSGNALMWLDFGDKRLADLDWTAYNHVLNETNVTASETTPIAGLTVYDLADRGRFIDDLVIDIIERYPAFNLAEMIRNIFKGYDIKSNFIAESWFTPIYLLFTQSNEIRNSDDWKESALFKASGGVSDTYSDTDLNAWTPFDFSITGSLVDNTGDNFDNGFNWDNTAHAYTIPETGTYRFQLNVNGTINTDNGGGDPAEMRYNSGGGNPKLIVAIRLNGTSNIAFTETQDYDFNDSVAFDMDADTDYIELTAGDVIDVYLQTIGEYRVQSAPGTGFDMVIGSLGTLNNKLSRYYGHGSTVEVNRLLPDMRVNDFLAALFEHFAITPQYSDTTNIVRLNTWQRQQSGYDLTYQTDAATIQAEFTEGFNYELAFRQDTSDGFATWFFTRDKSQNGNVEIDAGYNVNKSIRSQFCNTHAQPIYRIEGYVTDKAPVLWQTIPDDPNPLNWNGDALPQHRTNFGMRLLIYAGVGTSEYQFAYHTTNTGRTVATAKYVQFLPYTDTLTIEFADRGTLQGLHNRLHKAMIERINNGITLTVQGKVDINYLNNLVNSDDTINIGTAVYLSYEPFVGYYTINSVTTDGLITQFTLIRNEE